MSQDPESDDLTYGDLRKLKEALESGDPVFLEKFERFLDSIPEDQKETLPADWSPETHPLSEGITMIVTLPEGEATNPPQ